MGWGKTWSDPILLQVLVKFYAKIIPALATGSGEKEKQVLNQGDRGRSWGGIKNPAAYLAVFCPGMGEMAQENGPEDAWVPGAAGFAPVPLAARPTPGIAV